MTDAPNPATDPGQGGHEEAMSALFAQMVIQQANLAMMLLGKVPHPQSGQTAQDLEGARLFIDQLEMLQAKTRGNLSKDEEMLLKQSLMTVQMAFVEAVESPAARPAPEQTAPAPAAEPQATENQPAPESKPAAEDPESRKKFSKKY